MHTELALAPHTNECIAIDKAIIDGPRKETTRWPILNIFS